MKILHQPITISELKAIAQKSFGDLVKAVVDIETGLMVIGGELHADEEALLLERGSRQQNLWGINLYPELKEPDWIEFDSMINLRPSQGNTTRGVDNPKIRNKITQIVNQFIQR